MSETDTDTTVDLWEEKRVVISDLSLKSVSLYPRFTVILFVLLCFRVSDPSLTGDPIMIRRYCIYWIYVKPILFCVNRIKMEITF